MMVFTLILILLVIVFLAMFIGYNLSNTCTLWVFKTFENLPVSILVLISFSAGIIVSLFFFLISKIKRSKKNDDKNYIE